MIDPPPQPLAPNAPPLQPAARRVLVTGGSGFIGQHLVRLLVERGDRVRTLDIVPPRDRARDYEFVQGSILDPAALRRALAGVDRLFHVAGNPNLWVPRKADFARVNHEGTRLVLAEAARRDLERIVYTSTESILKGRRATRSADGLIDETVQLTLDDMPGPYCRSKFLGEQEALAAARRGQPVVIVNPTLPVGPGDFSLTPPTAMVLRFLNGRTPAYLDCELNFVDVRTAALGHILAAERGTVGERYILGGENLSLTAVLDLLRDLTGLPMPTLRVPYWLALAVSALDEAAADLVTRTPPVAPLTGVRLARSPIRFDCSKSIRELGLPQTPIKAAFADLIRWLAAEGYLTRKLPASAAGTALGIQRQ
jgi:dihydroflavonol-4-reductase